jgi:hypothetical protein
LDDPLSDVFSAMVQESPVAPSPTTTQKRPHDDIDPGSDKEGDSSIPAFTVSNTNAIQAVQCFAERERLRAEQITELNVFIKVSTIFFLLSILLTLFQGSGSCSRCQTTCALTSCI